MLRDESLKFQYVGCFLFKSYLVIANVQKSEKFTVKYLISLACAKIESADNMTGLQTASSNSWKVVFEYDFGVYEILLTAATTGEADCWKSHMLVQNCVANGEDYAWKFDASVQFAQGEGSTVLIPSNAKPLWVANSYRHNTISGGKTRRTSCYSQTPYSGNESMKTPLNVNINHFPVSQPIDSYPSAISIAVSNTGTNTKSNTRSTDNNETFSSKKKGIPSPEATSPSSDSSSSSTSASLTMSCDSSRSSTSSTASDSDKTLTEKHR